MAGRDVGERLENGWDERPKDLYAIAGSPEENETDAVPGNVEYQRSTWNLDRTLSTS